MTIYVTKTKQVFEGEEESSLLTLHQDRELPLTTEKMLETVTKADYGRQGQGSRP